MLLVCEKFCLPMLYFKEGFLTRSYHLLHHLSYHYKKYAGGRGGGVKTNCLLP